MYRVSVILVVGVVIVTFVLPMNVYGYLDPATGSILLQVVIGGLLAALTAVRIYWKKLKSLFKNVSGQG